MDSKDPRPPGHCHHELPSSTYSGSSDILRVADSLARSRMTRTAEARNLVESTNDCSILSKGSMVFNGYVQDEYVQHFIGHNKYARKRRSPIINRGYYVRFRAMEWALKSVFNQVDHSQFNHKLDISDSYDISKSNQIIQLGCGFDTLAFRFPDVHFLEIDFFHVAQEKANKIIENKLIDFDIDKDYINLDTQDNARPKIILKNHRYCLVSGDLRDSKKLVEFLESNNLLLNKFGSLSMLLNECSLCYLVQSTSDDLINRLIKSLRTTIIYVGYEQLKCVNFDNADGFAKVMLNHFKSIGSPIKTFLSKEEQLNRFKTLGFESCSVVDMLHFYHDIISKCERYRLQTLEPFDEHEEFDLLCSSYGITIAIKSDEAVGSLIESSSTESLLNKSKNDLLEFREIKTFKPVVRCGHSSCCIDNDVYMFGGFGFDDTCNNKHKRLSDIIKFNSHNNSITSYSINGITDGRIHSQLVALREDIFLISGGRTSPTKPMKDLVVKFNESTILEYENIKYSGAVPLPTSRHGIFHNMVKNQLVNLGGINCPHNEFHVLDIESMVWKKSSSGNASTNRFSHAICQIDPECFLVHGGLSNDGLIKDGVRIFDMRTAGSTTGLLIPNLSNLYSHKIHQISSNELIIVGGINDFGSHNAVCYVDIRNNSVVKRLNLNTDLTIMLHKFCSEVIDKKLYIFGGGGNCFSFGTFLNEQILLFDL